MSQTPGIHRMRRRLRLAMLSTDQLDRIGVRVVVQIRNLRARRRRCANPAVAFLTAAATSTTRRGGATRSPGFTLAMTVILALMVALARRLTSSKPSVLSKGKILDILRQQARISHPVSGSGRGKRSRRLLRIGTYERTCGWM